MILFAISTGLAILAWIGLAIGLVVLLVVVFLLNEVLTPLREIARHARGVPEVAPFVVTGVKGVEDLRRTSELASSVPPLAEAYLAKLSSAGTIRRAAQAPPPGGSGSSPGLVGRGKA